MKRKHVKYSGLFLWKKLSCKRLDILKDWWLLQAWCKHSWYSNDPSSFRIKPFNLETTRSLVKFIKNNIFCIRWKLFLVKWEKRQKLKRLSIRRQDIQTRHVELHGKTLGKRDCNILTANEATELRSVSSRGPNWWNAQMKSGSWRKY